MRLVDKWVQSRIIFYDIKRAWISENIIVILIEDYWGQQSLIVKRKDKEAVLENYDRKFEAGCFFKLYKERVTR